MIIQFLKNFAKFCDFIDRVLLRFIGERLIFAVFLLVFVWIKYGICKLKARVKRDTAR
ncbi:MAG: hypothetical protein LBD33_02060 [Puniceicoccales bacterium]|jgi:hypothetical protein|nr:hypothetical protein [Puniceicoccales bacterium]